MLSWVWGCADDPKSEGTANMGVTTVETTMETADSGNVPTEGGSETGCEGLELAQEGSTPGCTSKVHCNAEYSCDWGATE